MTRFELEQVVRQIKTYCASPKYKKEVIRNQDDTKEFLHALKYRCRLDDNMLSQKFTI
jgi:hypothetical protein